MHKARHSGIDIGASIRETAALLLLVNRRIYLLVRTIWRCHHLHHINKDDRSHDLKHHETKLKFILTSLLGDELNIGLAIIIQNHFKTPSEATKNDRLSVLALS
jgi:hypothetical protein